MPLRLYITKCECPLESLIRSFFLVLICGVALAKDDESKKASNNSGLNSPVSTFATSCTVAMVATTMARTKTPTLPLTQCEHFKIISSINNQDFTSSEEAKTSDGKTKCVKEGGYTTDYKDCKRLISLYDAVLLAEQAMISAQNIQVNEANTKSQKEVANRTAKGEGQNAAIDATIARNELNVKINKTQAATYSAAVASLSAGLLAWKGKKHFIKSCVDNGKFSRASNTAKETGKVTFNQIECTSMVTQYKESSSIFKNDNAKSDFMFAVGTFVQKAVEANKRAGLNEEVGEKLKAMPQMADSDELVLDPCLINPLAPCSTNKDKTFSSGSMGSGNTVNVNSISHETLDFSTPKNLDSNMGSKTDSNSGNSSTESVANANPSFSNPKESSKGVIDPASAASIASGGNSSSSPNGGGGGAGGGGGGSAALGDDLEGVSADKASEAQVKTFETKNARNKAGNNFVGISNRQSGQDEGPINFDETTKGGIEEAEYQSSVLGEKSPLIFDRISNRYLKIQASKRINQPASR